MQTVVAIADAGSLTAAARVLGVSLPAVVRLLAALEEDLGARLFHRTTRRIALTEAGRRYLERCRELETLLAEAEAEVRAEQTEARGKLTITAPVLFGTRHVANGIIEFVRLHPQVSVELQLLDRVVDLVEEGVDVGIRIGELEDSSLIARPASTMRRLTVAAPSYLSAHGAPEHPRDLLGHNCIRFSGTGSVPWAFDVGGKPVGVEVRGNLQVNQSAAAARACVAGLGVGTFLAYQIAEELASGSLAVVLAAFELPPRPIHVVYPEARLLPVRTRIFVDFILRHVQSQQAVWQRLEPAKRATARAHRRAEARSVRPRR